MARQGLWVMGMTRARRQKHVVIFARTPAYGRVKTRLARDVGSLAAWQFYRKANQRLIKRMAADEHWTVWLAETGDKRARVPGSYRCINQGHGDLAERMDRCLRHLPPGDAVLLGADIPTIRPAHIRRAFVALTREPVVFGPATDGGFWLVGARRVPVMPKPFFARAVRWSSVHTLQDTIAGMRLPVGLIDRLSDVDTGADFAAFRKANR